jgi:hydrogenase expression/formation protein HypE
VLVSGPVGDHGIAVMVARADLEFDMVLRSDSAPVSALVAALLVPGTHVLRDPTRGGLATALCEIAVASRVGIRLAEAAVPVRAEVQGGCELLGFDPLYVACEGPSTSGDAGARMTWRPSCSHQKTGR